MRKRLAFFCPRCGAEVKPPRGSKALESAVRGRLTPEEARRLVVIAHYRHAHTAYEDDMYSSRWLREGECQDGDDYCVAAVASEGAGRHYTKMAAELARMDSLLPSAAAGTAMQAFIGKNFPQIYPCGGISVLPCLDAGV